MISPNRIASLSASLSLIAMVSGCAVKPTDNSPGTKPSDGGGTATDAGTPVTTNLTWYHDIQPIMAENCTGCHVAGGIGPFDLSTYASFQTNAQLAVGAVVSKVMPPWMPSDDTPAMVGQRGLTDQQIQDIQDWVAGGMPEGDLSMEPSEPPPTDTFTASATMMPPSPYTPNASLGTDDYHCFVLDPMLTTDTAVTAFNILPGDRRVVHHVILYGVDTADQAKLATLEASGSGGGYTCFGGSGIDSSSVIGGWVPGTQATTFPAGTGVVVKAGTKIVMQVHYNLLIVQNTTDQTTAQIEYAPKNAIINPAYITPVYNTTFSIPPGAVQTVTASFNTDSLNLPQGTTITVWGMLPHMHLHGTDINVTNTPMGGSETMMVHIPHWQFQWQQMYFFQQPFVLGAGDQATLSCTFDNTAANQPVVNGVQLTPGTLTWGEDTLNEMCLNFFYATAS